MFVVIICTTSTGRVERKSFDTWEAARSFASTRDGKNGQRVRIDLERAQRPVAPLLAIRLNRCLTA